MSERPIVTDARLYPLELGSEIDGGNGVVGVVVGFWERAGGQVAVAVEWPDSPLPEVFETELRFGAGFPLLFCSEFYAA